MAVFLFLLFVATANLGLGCALAICLGYGPPSLCAVWDNFSRSAPSGVSAPDAQFAQDLSRELALASAELDLGMELDEQLDVQLNVEPYDDDACNANESANLDADAPEDWDLNEKYVETSILKLNVAMIKSGLRATDIDTRLRTCRGATDLPTIQRCVAELKEDCENYLVEQSEAAETFHNRLGELGELASLGEEIELANLQQASQIETTVSNLTHMDLASDLEAANARLIEELKNLRIARHALRDSQEAAFLTIARYENRLDKLEKRLFNDPLTKLRNRIGFEATLWQWWQEERQRSRQITAAMFDLEGLGLINEAHGPLIGDRVLYHIANLIDKLRGPADLPARFSGQRFIVMFVDAGPRVAMKNAEFLRQSIGRVTFQHNDEEIHVAARGAITEVKATDTMDVLFKRLEEALAAAKASGSNRSFQHNGREPELIESPNLGAQYVEIPI